MTTSIDIKTRGLGAKVEVDNGETFEVGPNQTRRIDTEGAVTVTVTQNQASEEERVPGSSQNDELVREVPAETLDKASGRDRGMGNKTGATETAQTTETK